MEKPDKSLSKLTVYIHGNEQKVGPLCESHESTVKLCRKIFPAIAHATEVGFYAMDLDISKNCPIEICAATWKDVTASTHIKKMVVVDQSSKMAAIQDRKDGKPATRKVQFKIKTMTGKTVSVDGDITVADLKERMQQVDGTPVHLQQFVFHGAKMADDTSMGFYEGETIHLRWK